MMLDRVILGINNLFGGLCRQWFQGGGEDRLIMECLR